MSLCVSSRRLNLNIFSPYIFRWGASPFVGRIYRHLTGWRPLQIEYIWVSECFSQWADHKFNIASEEALDTGVHIVRSRVYPGHLHDAVLGLTLLISRLVMPGCVLSCMYMFAAIHINRFLIGSLVSILFVCPNPEIPSLLSWPSRMKVGIHSYLALQRWFLIPLMIDEDT